MKMHQDHAPKMTFPFQTIASDFRMIESFMQPIFVPFDEEAESLLAQLNTTDEVGRLLRKLQPYIVQIPLKGFEALQMAGVIQTVAPHRFEDQFWQLINQDIYDPEFGISWDNPGFIKAESSVI
jgi:CRISPR-associated endonuclease/helicase Cas3